MEGPAARPAQAARRDNHHERQTTARFRITGQLIAGLVLAGLGVLFTLDNLDIVRARDVLRYWPAVLLLVGISQILQARSPAGMVGGSIWILFGAVLLGERLNLISNVFRFWPLLLVGVGAYVVWQSFNRRELPPGDRSDRVSAVAVLGGVDRRVISTTSRAGTSRRSWAAASSICGRPRWRPAPKRSST